MPAVFLKAATRDDAAELIRSHAESRPYHAPWAAPFTDVGGFEDWFAGLATGANVGLIARDISSDSIVGVVHLSQIFLKGFQNAYLGFHGMAGWQARGLMTEAVRLGVRHAFDEVGLHRLEANVQPTNLRSIALIRRVGFRKEGFSPRYLRIGGIWCDHERWALLADEIVD